MMFGRFVDLVGRDTELGALRAVLSNGGVAIVEGEAGIGKSRLVRELVSSLGSSERARVLVAACPALPTPDTLAALVDALRDPAPALDRSGRTPGDAVAASAAARNLSPLGGALRDLFPEWSDRLPPPLPPSEDAAAARHRVFRAMIELVSSIGIRTVIVEDVHWADDATLELLLFAASQPTPPFGLVITVRPYERSGGSLLSRLARLGAGATGVRLSLAPLDVPATAQLVSAMLDGQSVSSEFAAFLHEATDGLPLAIEETMRLLTDRADVVQRDGAWIRRHLDRMPLPPTVRDVVLERRDRLGDDARSILAASAVLGEPAGLDLLESVADLPEPAVHAGVGEALASGLLTIGERGVVGFAHALSARAVYESIPSPARQQLHARAGRALASRGGRSPGTVARHFREAGDTAAWSTYAERAADLALGTGDEATAIALLHDVCVHADLSAAEANRLISKVPFAALESREVWSDLVDVLRRLLGSPDLTPWEEGVLRYRLGIVLGAMYETAEGRVLLEQAVPLLDDEPAMAARAMIMLGWPSNGTLTAAEHHAWLERAAEPESRLPPEQRSVVVVDRTTALLMLGDARGWADADGIPLQPDPGWPVALVMRGNLNVGDQAMVWGRYELARTRIDAALALAEEAEYVRLHTMIRATELHLDWLAGVWTDVPPRAAGLLADDDLASATRLEVHLVLGQHAAATGSFADAEEHLRRVVEGWASSGAAQLYPAAAAALARLHLERGVADAARAVTDAAVEFVRETDGWLWATDLAPAHVETLVASGDRSVADAVVRDLEARARSIGAPGLAAAVATATALLAAADGDHRRATDLFRDAEHRWSALPRPYAVAWSRERRAESLLADGDNDDAAIAELEELHSAYAGLGATVAAARVAKRLATRGVRVGTTWRGGTRGYGDRLSPREAEVVRLVIAGHTNREVAAALSRSPHTVDTQLRAAMRKLGVASRAGLALRLLETEQLDDLTGG